MGEEIVRSYKKQRELAGCLLGCMYDYVWAGIYVYVLEWVCKPGVNRLHYV
jgi:hypothetical protein